ncbi:hypothetical protein [Streptomyces sp. NPDC005969]|uniref:hypothetical protein n=1 Tax=Streptomyces sp. NPDC005969 TaxID=3156722 RepID=UPI0033C66C95
MEGEKVRPAAVNPVDWKASEGHLRSGPEAVRPLEQAADGQGLDEEERTRGKIVVTVPRDN